MKYAIKFTAAVKQLPASFVPISPFAVALLQFFTDMSFRSSVDIAHLLNLHGADSTALSEVIADHFVGENPEEEVLGMLTLFSN